MEQQKIFLDKERITPVVMRLFEDETSGGESDRQLAVSSFMEMCQDIFGGDSNQYSGIASATLVSRETPVLEGSSLARRNSISNTPLEGHSSHAGVVQKCLRKYRQVLRRHYDIKSITLDKFLKQSDLNTARKTACQEAVQAFNQVKNVEKLSQDESLEIQFKQQLALEYSWVAKVNEHKRHRFLERVCGEIGAGFSEKLESRYSFLFSSSPTPSGPDHDVQGKLLFCDAPRLEQYIKETVNETLEDFKEYFQFSSDQPSSSNPSQEAHDHLTKLQNELLQKNRNALEKAQAFMKSHVEDCSTDCRVGIEKALEDDPFLSKSKIQESVINPKVLQYKNQFSMMIVCTEDNEKFQKDFETELNSNLERELKNALERSRMKQQRTMAQYSDDIHREIPELIRKISNKNKIDHKHAAKLTADLIDEARRSLRKIKQSLGIKSSNWSCVPISVPKPSPRGPTSNFIATGAFSIQLSFTGIRVGFLKDHVPHVLQYSTGADTSSTKIPLLVGITTASHPDFVFGHTVEERRQQNCLQNSWDLAEMLDRKQTWEQVQSTIKHRHIKFQPTLELLLGLLIRYCHKLCVDNVRSGNSGEDMCKCIISLPPRLLPFQRLQIKNAAIIAGFEDTNVRLVNETACLVYQACEGRNQSDSVTMSPISPNDDGTKSSDEFLVISQYADYRGSGKLDFAQYKRNYHPKIALEHYIDEEIILQRHMGQCKNCSSGSSGSVKTLAYTTTSAKSLCAALKNVHNPLACLDTITALMKEALSHTRNSKVACVILNCEMAEWKNIFERNLSQYLPNIAINIDDGVKCMGEFGILQGLIYMGSWKKGLLHCWINDLYTRSGSVWVKNRSGIYTTKLGGYKMNERLKQTEDTNADVWGQLSSDHKEVCVQFGWHDHGPGQDDVVGGTMKILKEILETQTIYIKFNITKEGTFKLLSAELYLVKPDKQMELLNLLEIGKDYEWTAGNISDEQLKQCKNISKKFVSTGHSDSKELVSSNKSSSASSSSQAASKTKSSGASSGSGQNTDARTVQPMKRPPPPLETGTSPIPTDDGVIEKKFRIGKSIPVHLGTNNK